MTDLLPYHAKRPQPGASGTALYGRAPFRGERTLHPDTWFDQARAQFVHSGVSVDVVAVHLTPPIPDALAMQRWRADLAQLPAADPDDGVVTVLAGDFNATMDHSAFRWLLGTGYVDAADATGAGLIPTWHSGWVPPVTLDHIVVERGVGVRDVRVYDMGRSDHRAVVADLALPKP